MGKLKKFARTKETGSPRKASHASQPEAAEAEPISLDRRRLDRRKSSDRRQQNIAVVAERRKTERRKIPRRRQIDPTTCERDYSLDEIEFMGAMDAYKRSSGRMFPTCSEVLEVLRGLGYEKRPVMPVELAPAGVEATPAAVPPNAV